MQQEHPWFSQQELDWHQHNVRQTVSVGIIEGIKVGGVPHSHCIVFCQTEGHERWFVRKRSTVACTYCDSAKSGFRAVSPCAGGLHVFITPGTQFVCSDRRSVPAIVSCGEPV